MALFVSLQIGRPSSRISNLITIQRLFEHLSGHILVEIPPNLAGPVSSAPSVEAQGASDVTHKMRQVAVTTANVNGGVETKVSQHPIQEIGVVSE